MDFPRHENGTFSCRQAGVLIELNRSAVFRSKTVI
jgi:hypothetical protein